MFNQLVSFWESLYLVFFPRNYHTYFNMYSRWSVDGVTYTSRYGFLTLYHLDVCKVLSALTLIGLSVFLFYQIYKVIHAFVGGFYEDAI